MPGSTGLKAWDTGSSTSVASALRVLALHTGRHSLSCHR